MVNPTIQSSYIICSTMRSGSTLLSRTLKDFDVAGDPKEYFHPRWKGVGLDQLSEPSQLYAHYNCVVRETTTPNGVFGIKMHWDQLQNVLNICRKDTAFSSKNDLEILQSFFPRPKFIFIWRENLLKQAVSTEIANQTQIWGIDRDPNSMRHEAKRMQLTDLKFKPMQIYRHKQSAQKCNTQWKQFFSQYSIPYHEVKFESLISNFESEMRGVFRCLNLPSDCSSFSMATKKQSTPINERWAFYYRLIPEILLEQYHERQHLVRRSLSL
ncbi:MAG: Stf0 family sulfotransferase [Cyanobacteria bacterium J06631_9]